MKFHSLLSILALTALALFSACGSDSEASKGTTLMTEEGTQPAVVAPDAAAGTNAAPPAEPPQNAAGLWHYTCPKGCAGGAGAATACATCGTTLTHSQAYHGAPGTQPAAAAPSSTPGAAPGAQTINMPNTGKAEPPQNAAGVWHYTCPAGCAGGGGAAGPCAKCGKTLEHNKAYH